MKIGYFLRKSYPGTFSHSDIPVSYTHLDVYKRQSKQFARFFADLVSVQESCFVHNETVDDTYFLNPVSYTHLNFHPF